MNLEVVEHTRQKQQHFVEHTRQGELLMNHEIIEKVIFDQHQVSDILVPFS